MIQLELKYQIIISAFLSAVFISLWMVEVWFPLRAMKRSKAGRLWINICVSGTALAAGAYIVAPVALNLASWSQENSFGLLRIVALPFGAELLFGFLLMDLTFYYWHRANHVLPLFWRFHSVHHVDPDLDVSTSFRFHFGEVLYSLMFRAFQVYLLGISMSTYLVYELVFQCATLFHHSNVRLPLSIERALNRVVVTPRMHGIHHSNLRIETNANYSVVFRWWDSLHGTLRLNVKQSLLVIGVAGYSEPKDNNIVNLFLSPFRKQKDYWPLNGEKRPERMLPTGRENILVP